MKKLVRVISTEELPILTQLFDYNDVGDMLLSNARDIESGRLEIYAMFEGDRIVGELHVIYKSEDKDMTISGVRAYLCAFRIHADFQGRGYGKELMQTVLDILKDKGYSEVCVGVEDDNDRAIHIYNKFGFETLVARKAEEYQGCAYEFNLYLKQL